MTATLPIKKAKVKDTHRMAIEHYEKWLKQNRKATRSERINYFNEAVDLAAEIRERKS